MRTNKNNYAPDLYISVPSETSCKTPTEIIVSHIYMAYKAKDKKQVDFLVNLVFEMQKFWVDYLYSDIKSDSGVYLHTSSDAAWVIEILGELSDYPEYAEKLFPFVETRYKKEAIHSLFFMIRFALEGGAKAIPDHIYKETVQVAKTILVENTPDWHELHRKEFYNYIELRLSIIDNLAYFKPEDAHPILNHVIANKQEADLLVKVSKGIISGKPYLGSDLDPWMI